MSCGPTKLVQTDWRGCYDGSWKGLIVDDAFAHPAKFAYGLICRIVDHGLREGYWKPGDLIGDPFGGVALGGIICGGRGLNWIGVELEERFVDLGNRNLGMHGPVFMASGASCVKLVEGDSRGFAAIAGEVVGVITSPPYTDTTLVGEYRDPEKCRAREERYLAAHPELKGKRPAHLEYGSFPGQIGSLKSGSVDGVISSPPYAESVKGDHGETETAEDSQAKRNTAGGSLGRSQRHGGYGVSDGQIGALKEGALDGAVTSPPYQQGIGHGGGETYAVGRGDDGYVDAAVGGYGQSPGQIGNATGETYWQAMHTVYSQMRLAMKPGAVAAIIVKDYVKQKQRVLLCDDTCRMLESVGFRVFERTRAWLVKEHRQPGLFGEDCIERKERKSFFRRLAEKKGSPRIDWEEVIWVLA